MEEREKKREKAMLINILGGILASLVLTGLSLLIISAVYLTRDLSDETARKLVTACAFFSVFLSSAAAGKKGRHKGLLTGTLIGAGYSLCLYITGFLAFGFLPGVFKGPFVNPCPFRSLRSSRRNCGSEFEEKSLIFHIRFIVKRLRSKTSGLFFFCGGLHIKDGRIEK